MSKSKRIFGETLSTSKPQSLTQTLEVERDRVKNQIVENHKKFSKAITKLQEQYAQETRELLDSI